MQRSDVPIAIEVGGVELRMREAGDAFYWGPGHAPEALDDCEYVDFSPTEAFARVIAHIKGQ
ncbi:MAG: hypothetical protein ABIQ05_03030 [Candidatus Limnocylindria bacterium]